MNLRPGGTVVFTGILYKLRAHRDRVNAKAMKDPRLADNVDPKALRYDGKHMFRGGFKVMNT